MRFPFRTINFEVWTAGRVPVNPTKALIESLESLESSLVGLNRSSFPGLPVGSIPSVSVTEIVLDAFRFSSLELGESTADPIPTWVGYGFKYMFLFNDLFLYL